MNEFQTVVEICQQLNDEAFQALGEESAVIISAGTNGLACGIYLEGYNLFCDQCDDAYQEMNVDVCRQRIVEFAKALLVAFDGEPLEGGRGILDSL